MDPLVQTLRPMSLAEWIEFEEAAEARHEFFDGECRELWPMTARHAGITTELCCFMHESLRDTRHRYYIGSLRIAAARGRRYFYPNGTIFEGEPKDDPDDPVPFAYATPKVVFEVLERESEHYDRGKKLRAWTEVEGIEEVVFIGSERFGGGELPPRARRHVERQILA